MKVIVLGGYGEFGGRLCRMLIKDDHEVLVAGRSPQTATDFCEAHGGTPLIVDVRTDLSALSKADADVVVDCIGPFQLYRQNRYRVARFAVTNGLHYLDIADDGDFVAGISELDFLAKTNDVFALSGASSTPAITSAAVTLLSANIQCIDLIRTAICPGSGAPRGRSTMTAILSQVGKGYKQWRNGEWVDAVNWARNHRLELEPGNVRNVCEFNAADNKLLPKSFDTKSVIFLAGLELPVMHHSLRSLSWLHSLGWMPSLEKLTPLLDKLAQLLVPLGSNRGGMQVEVVGKPIGSVKPVRNTWSMISEAGVGPNIPLLPVRAIINAAAEIAPGARPSISALPVEAYERAAADLDIRVERGEEEFQYLVQEALGENWSALSPQIRETHAAIDGLQLVGKGRVDRGSGLFARIACAIFGFPPTASNITVCVHKQRDGCKEVWTRFFDGKKFRSVLTNVDGKGVIEQFGPFKFLLRLHVEDAQLKLPVARGWFLGIPLPRLLLPTSESSELVIDGLFHFDVRLGMPVTNSLLVHYRGSLEPKQHTTVTPQT